MKLIFAVKDQATDAFGMPFFLNTKGEAMRSFTDEINSQDPNSALAKHPEDYELWIIGSYQKETATITSDGEDEHERLCRGKDVVKPRS